MNFPEKINCRLHKLNIYPFNLLTTFMMIYGDSVDMILVHNCFLYISRNLLDFFWSFDVIKLALSWLNLVILPKRIFQPTDYKKSSNDLFLTQPINNSFYFPKHATLNIQNVWSIPLILDKRFFFFDSSYTQFCGVITWNHKNSTFSYFHSNKNPFNRSFTQRKNPDIVLYFFKKIFFQTSKSFFFVARSDIMFIHKYVKKIFPFFRISFILMWLLIFASGLRQIRTLILALHFWWRRIVGMDSWKGKWNWKNGEDLDCKRALESIWNCLRILSVFEHFRGFLSIYKVFWAFLSIYEVFWTFFGSFSVKRISLSI